jgi:hypothetical protein
LLKLYQNLIKFQLLVLSKPMSVLSLTVQAQEELPKTRVSAFTLTGKPVQTPTANAPNQLPPAQPQAQAPTKWEDVVNGAINASTKQHNGKPQFGRVCQPETKTCATAVFFTSKDGLENIVVTIEDSNGKVVKRETCKFNQFSDVRNCVDFDRGTTRRDMKDANGNWVKIEDQ